jgi:hypothetical protein
MSTNRKNGITSRHSAPKATATIEATHDHIRGRAYEIYCERCDRNEGGDHVSDWLQAEQELNGHAQSEPIAEPSSNRTQPHDRSVIDPQASEERLVHA